MLWTEKYRPKRFEEIAGQEQMTAHMASFARKKNVPHLLIAGPHGTGKSAVVECMARMLYGEHWKENTTFLQTGDLFRSGKQYLKDDERFVHLFKNNLSLIANVKHIIKWYASMRPFEADFKLLVFEEADALTFEAQQALRRIMERYSNTCRFIFIVSSTSAMIPAISSRCLPLFFVPVEDETARHTLEKICEKEGIDETLMPKEECDYVITAAEGDLRKATLYLQVLAQQKGQCELSDLLNTETMVLTGKLFALLRAGNLAGAKSAAESLMIDYGLSGREVIEELRDVTKKEYNDKRIALILGSADVALLSAGNEFVQIHAMLSRIVTEIFQPV